MVQRLPAVGGDDQDGRPLARLKVSAVVPEAGEVDGDQSQHEGLTGAAPADEPCFGAGGLRSLRAARTGAVDRGFGLGQRQAEQGAYEASPGCPGVGILEPRRKQLRVGHGLKQVHAAGLASM
ncbi:hypothetical protein ACRBEV_23555 [Methylobacterium phyllosphaerae]